jgi:hypothetical protein
MIYNLLGGAFANSVPIAIRVDIRYSCTLLHWIKWQEMHLSDAFSGLQSEINSRSGFQIYSKVIIT